MNYQIDQSLSIYIPRIGNQITEKYIAEIFAELDIGTVSRVDVIDLPNKSQNSAYVHFSEWNNTDAVGILQDRIRDPTQQAKIVYSAPWFWFLLPNTSPDADSIGVVPMEIDPITDDRGSDPMEIDQPEYMQNTLSTPVRSYASVLGGGLVVPSRPQRGVARRQSAPPPTPTDEAMLEMIARDCDEEYQNGVTEMLNEQLRTVIEDLQCRLAQCEQLAVNTAAKQENNEEGLIYSNNLISSHGYAINQLSICFQQMVHSKTVGDELV